MNTAIIICVFIALLAVTLTMVLGIVAMVKGREFNKKYGNKLMQARVSLQGVAIALLALAYFIS